jgi:hypothetical protein
MRRYVLLICAVAACAAGGYAYASSTGDATISACAKSANGQLRLDTGGGCLPSETAVEWNRTGPQGPPGPSGTSHVDEWAQFAGVGGGVPIVNGVWPAIRGHDTVLKTFHLAAGQYLVSTEVLGVNNDGQGVFVCRVGNDQVGNELAQAAIGNAAGFALQQTMVEQTVFDIPAGGSDLELRCFNAPPNEPMGNPMVNFWDIAATTIDSSTFEGVPNP